MPISPLSADRFTHLEGMLGEVGGHEEALRAREGTKEEDAPPTVEISAWVPVGSPSDVKERDRDVVVAAPVEAALNQLIARDLGIIERHEVRDGRFVNEVRQAVGAEQHAIIGSQSQLSDVHIHLRREANRLSKRLTKRARAVPLR